jgi:hypothetical protein
MPRETKESQENTAVSISSVPAGIRTIQVWTVTATPVCSAVRASFTSLQNKSEIHGVTTCVS